MYPALLDVSLGGTGLENTLLNSQLTLVGALSLAVLFLWRLTAHYHKRSQEESQAARAAADKSHEETKALLREQNQELHRRNDLLVDRVKQEQDDRRKEMEQHLNSISEITSDYKAAIAGFNENLNKISTAIDSQVGILQQLSALPSQVSSLQHTVEFLQNDVKALKQREVIH